MKIFQIDYKRLIILLLPIRMRQAVTIAFLRSCINPISRLHGLFISNRNANLYRLKANGQVCYLRKTLNDAFPERDKSFEIGDGAASGKWVYALKEPEYGQLFVPKEPEAVTLYSIPVILSGTANFVVFIPANLAGIDYLNRIKSIVNEYKLVSKKPSYEYN